MKVLSSLIVSLGLIFNFAFSQHTMFTQTWKQESTEFSSTIVYSVDMKTTGGNIYHIGKVHNGSNWDVVVAKVNNAGSVLWRQQYDGGTDDFAISVGVDNSGNVYAIMRSIISGTSRARVVKYNTSGTYQWVWNTTTGATGQFPNYGYTDVSGNTYVVGTDGANNSILTYKITTAGAISFSAVYAPNSSLRNSSQVITDATSNVYVCGWQNTASSGTDWVVLKYNSSGTQQWVQTYGGTGNDTAKTIIVDGASNIIVGGRYSSTEAHVRKYTPTGTASWTNTVNYFIDANSSVILQVDNSNNIYAAVCQQDYVSNNKPLHIKKISTSGASLWNKYYNGPTATYSQPSDYFQNYPKQILVHNDSNYVYVGIDGPSKSNIGSIRRGFHIGRFRMTDGSFDDDLDNVSHNFCYPELAFTTTIAFADNNQSIIIAGSHPDMSYSTPPLKIRTVKYGLYSPAVKAHGPSYLLSTKMSYIKLCDLNARNVSDSCRLEPTGIQSGYSYWWVSTNVSNEDALTQYFTDRSNPNSYFNPPAGFFSANYKLKITDLFGNIIYSSPVSIQRYAFDNSVVTSGSTNICNGDTVTLSMPQIDIQYSLANMVKIGSPNQNLQSYAGSYASSNQPLIYNATTSGQFFFDVECTPIVSLNAYSGYNFMSTTFGGCFYYSDTISVTLGTPTITGTTPGSRCGTGTVTLGATGSAGTLSWYATPTGGSALGTGTSFVTPSISSTTTYYVEAVSGSCTSSRTAVTATINTVPTITGTTPGSRCGTGTVTLGATGSAGTLSWYATPTGGSALGTGTSFVTPSISSTTTYYVEAVSGSCTSSRTAVTATINTVPTITGTTPGSRCGTGTVTLGATGSAGTLSWYATPTGGSALGTGTSFVTPSISSTTTYYVEVYDGICASSRTPVTATINIIPTITSTTPGARCGTGTVTLGATGSAGTLSWYATPTGGSALGTGTSFVTPSISSTTTYYVEAVSGSCTSSRTAVTATINTVPTITGTTPGSRCGTGTVTLGATGSAGTLSWYATPTGGSALGTGTSFVTPSISSTTTYYVEAVSGSCTSSRTAVTATVNTVPTITGTTPGSRCGTGTVTLGATGSAGTLSWYATPTGGSALGTGTSFVTPSISSTTTYYVEVYDGICASSRTPVTATINIIPTITSTTPGARCGTGTVTLGATGSAGTLSWYATPTGGSALGTGTSFVTPSISSTTTYYVEVYDGVCTSSRTGITASVNSSIDITGTSPSSRCDVGTVTLGATSSSGIISWYDMPTGGSVLGTGNTFITPVISITTTYYAEATEGSCLSNREAVIATINTSPSATVSLSGNTLSVLESGLSYQWVDCNNGNMPIVGENGQSYVVNTDGYYAVEVTANGCTTTSTCVSVNTSGIDFPMAEISYSIFPNPSFGQFTIDAQEVLSSVVVFDALGRIVYAAYNLHINTVQVDLRCIRAGVYYACITMDGKTATEKIIIK